MTSDHARIVTETWQHVRPIADAAVASFYERLFAIDPSTPALFAGVPMERQRQKLAQALDAAVNGLRAPDALVPVLQELGRRHQRYGVTDAHYDSVGAALLWTLEQGLGAAWTAEAAEAWTAVYGLVAGTMREAATSVMAA